MYFIVIKMILNRFLVVSVFKATNVMMNLIIVLLCGLYRTDLLMNVGAVSWCVYGYLVSLFCVIIIFKKHRSVT